MQTAWAALTPPRAGWEPVGSLDAAALVEVARAGIAEVAQGAPAGAGGHAVTDLRQRVWGRLTETVPPVPAGAAFAAYVLGFLDPSAALRRRRARPVDAAQLTARPRARPLTARGSGGR